MTRPVARAPRRVVILGSTGSVGTQALDVIAAHPDELAVAGLGAAGRDLAALAAQVVATGCTTVALFIPDAAAAFPAVLRQVAAQQGATVPAVRVLAGPSGMEELAAAECDVVLNGITGSVGLGPTLAALRAGRTLALANKESLVAGGALVRAAKTRPDQIVPVDSEHSALAQCLRAGRAAEVARLLLTASGGPFRGWTRDQLADVTPQQALAHPTWAMGPVVTVNSSTMVNKALELIEAHLLFDVPAGNIDVVVHPQSYVHSMVEFWDGSVIAQVSPPDMRLPIALGLTWPERLDGVRPAADFTVASAWTFEPLDEDVFPAVRLARQALEASALHPAAFNAANEVLVEAFLQGGCRYLDIVDYLAQILAQFDAVALSGQELTLETVHETERVARGMARRLVERR